MITFIATMSLENAAPQVHGKLAPRCSTEKDDDDDVRDGFDSREIFGKGSSGAA